MRVRTPHIISMGALALSACASYAQSTPIPSNTTAPAAAPVAPPAPPVTTKSGFDLIRIGGDQLTIPLKFGHIVMGSVHLDLDGNPLNPTKDYVVDELSGTVTLMVPHHAGSVLRATYLYDSKQKQEGTYGSAGGTGQAFDIAPGTVGSVGFGVTERLADGTAVSSNVLGMSQTMSLGIGTLKGGIFMGQRQQSAASNMFEARSNNIADNSGSGVAIIQSLSSKVLGGSATMDYQSIDSKFAAFNSVKVEGVDTGVLAKEQGMKRVALGLTGANILSGKAGFSMRSVGNGQGSVTWRDASYDLRGTKVSWSQSVVDPNFNRFTDLREQDRDQLGHEKGLDRETFGIVGKNLTVDSLKVQDLNGNGIYRRHATLGYGALKLGFDDQRVDDNFNRFTDLREQDKAELAHEVGVSREKMTFGLYGLTGTTSALRGDKGNFDSSDFHANVGAVQVNWGHETADLLFDKFANLAPQDATDRVNQALAFLDPTAKPQGGDLPAFANMGGFERSGLSTIFNLGKGHEISFMKGSINETGQGGTNYDKLALAFGGVKAFYSGQQTDSTFIDAGKLLPSEQQRLGVAAGLHKTELNLTDDLGGGKTLTFDQMSANDPTGDAGRTKIAYEKGTFGFDYIRRSVSANFAAASTLADPENALLNSMKGNDDAQMDAHWTMAKLFKLEAASDMQSNEATAQTIRHAHDVLTFGVGTKTSLVVTASSESTNTAGVDTHKAQTVDTGLVTDLGKMGVFEIHHQQVANTGTTDTTPSAEKNDFKLTTKISKTTDVVAERADTSYSDGTHDSLIANTVRTAINPRLSVSVTDSHLDHANNAPTEAHREYGAAVDFGKGIKLSIGMARQMNADASGTTANTVAMTGGQAQGVKFDGATYTHNGWDDTRDQHMGHVSFANAKPMEWGMFKDVHFHYLTDTARDNYLWQKETSDYGIGASIGKSSFEAGYLSQMDASGYRAIDRTFKFSSDKDNKAPLRFNITYGARTLPTDDLILFRDYSLSWAMRKNLLLEHSVVTNPLQNTANVLLNSVPLDERRDQWSLKLSNDPKNHFEAAYKETRRDNLADALYREATITYTLFADNPSPLNLTYGLVQWTRNGDKEGSHKFGISYTQRPGPNQSLSFAFETYNFENAIATNNTQPQSWVLRVDFFSRH